MKQPASLAIIIAALIFLPGCGDGGIERHDLYGTVTFNGQPVPAGRVSFRPDRSKGGTGPAGFGQIWDGEYSTGDTGKGPVAGPVEVIIQGAVSKEPMSAALFPVYRTTIDVNGEVSEFNFEVPEQPQVTRRRR